MVAHPTLNGREEPNTNGVNDPDIRLNEISTSMGQDMHDGDIATLMKHGIAIHPWKGLADQIRKKICE